MTKEEIKQRIKKIIQRINLLRKLKELLKRREKIQMEVMIRVICRGEGLRRGDEELILAVLKCESGLNPKAINKNKDGTYDYGIAQYNSYWYIEKMKLITKEEALNNPEKCVRLMIKRWKEGHIKDWVCFSSGKYTSYL